MKCGRCAPESRAYCTPTFGRRNNSRRRLAAGSVSFLVRRGMTAVTRTTCFCSARSTDLFDLVLSKRLDADQSISRRADPYQFIKLRLNGSAVPVLCVGASERIAEGLFIFGLSRRLHPEGARVTPAVEPAGIQVMRKTRRNPGPGDFKIIDRLTFPARLVHAPQHRKMANRLHELFRGTFVPFLRAFESAIAMACLRLLTLPPLPLRAVPRL
jgi:hypothetical protein